MMRLSNLSLTPALTGLIMVTLLLLGAIVVRVITVSEHGEVRTHTARETSGQGTLKQGILKQDTLKQDILKQDTLDIGIADLKGTLR